MATESAPDTGSRNPLKGKSLAGIPWWIWAAGVTAAVGGYLYFRHVNGTAATNAASTGSAGTSSGAPTGLTSSQFQQFLNDQQSSPSAKSGWIKVAGHNVFYSAKNNTLGFRQGGKWQREAV